MFLRFLDDAVTLEKPKEDRRENKFVGRTALMQMYCPVCDKLVEAKDVISTKTTDGFRYRCIACGTEWELRWAKDFLAHQDSTGTYSDIPCECIIGG